MQQDFEYDVFISYSSQDRQWVRTQLLTRIEKRGLRAFIDFRDFRRGAPSIKEMERGVATCRKTLLILTPAYTDSEWCELENIMLQTLSPTNQDLRLIPLLKKPCKKPLRISALTHIDFTKGADSDLAWNQLFGALKSAAATPRTEPLPADIQVELDKAKKLKELGKHDDAIPVLERMLPLIDRLDNIKTRIKVRVDLAHALYEARDDTSNAHRYFRDALALTPGEPKR